MKNIKQMQDWRDELIEQIKNISLSENLSKETTINELNSLKGELYKINLELKNETIYNNDNKEENLVDDLESSLDTFEKNIVEEKQIPKEDNNDKYYQSMSITYIDDNGNISEIYRINEEIVEKEIFESWSKEYFTITREKNKQKFEDKIKKEINVLEEKINEKRNILGKSYKNSEPTKKSFYNDDQTNDYVNWISSPKTGYEGLRLKFNTKK